MKKSSDDSEFLESSDDSDFLGSLAFLDFCFLSSSISGSLYALLFHKVNANNNMIRLILIV
jgi:hypothetical protein